MPRSLPSSLRVRSGGGAGSSSLSAGTGAPPGSGTSHAKPGARGDPLGRAPPGALRSVAGPWAHRCALSCSWEGTPAPAGLLRDPRRGSGCKAPPCPRVVGAGLRAQGWRSLWRALCVLLLVRPGVRPCPEEPRLQAEWRRDRGRHQERPCEGVLSAALSLRGEQGLGPEAPPFQDSSRAPVEIWFTAHCVVQLDL